MVLFVAGILIGIQRWSIATMESDNVMLRQQLAAARSAGLGAHDNQAAAPNAEDKGPRNWKKLAVQYADMRRRDNRGNGLLLSRLQQCAQEMTPQEAIAALDEIATLHLPDASCNTLEQMFIWPLVQKDPELALKHFSDRLQDERSAIIGHLANALGEWAKKDAGQAGAWFDQQIAAGKFASKALDGKSRRRIEFEGMMIGVLLASDPAAAARRLVAMPEAQRAQIMNPGIISGTFREEDQLAYAQLVRAQVPAEDQVPLFGAQASFLAQTGGYDKVTGYLARIEATPAERTACVEQSAGWLLLRAKDKPVTREDFEVLRAWLGTQAPELTDRVTGRLLGNGKMAFADAGALALQYSQASGNDDVLGIFLESAAARSNKEAARILAEKIADENRRAAILKRLE